MTPGIKLFTLKIFFKNAIKTQKMHFLHIFTQIVEVQNVKGIR